jgi:hypothetical protein
MKINEILTEANAFTGFLKGVAAVAGGVATGVGKGVADTIAPGLVDKIKGAFATSELKNNTNAARPPEPAVLAKATDQLVQLASRNKNIVQLNQIGAVLANLVNHTNQDQLIGEIKYVGAELAQKNIKIPGLNAGPLYSSDDRAEWDPRSRILTIIGAEETGEANYRKLKTPPGDLDKWFDIHSDEAVIGKGNSELTSAFKKAQGLSPDQSDDPDTIIGSMPITAAEELRIELTNQPGKEYFKFPSGVWFEHSPGVAPVRLTSAQSAQLDAMRAGSVKTIERRANPRMQAARQRTSRFPLGRSN